MPDLAVEADWIPVAVLAALLFTQNGIICCVSLQQAMWEEGARCICRLLVFFSFAVVMVASVM